MVSRLEPTTGARIAHLFGHELRRLASGWAWWGMLLVLAPLVGFGYVEAVRLYGEASVTALQSTELARGLTPLDGIAVPTFGAFYLATTLLFPFVAIRALGQDKESGALKLILQWPLPTALTVATKVLAVLVAWTIGLVVPLSALGHWLVSGGHLGFAETANLILGHGLYALTVCGIAFFAAALTETAASAAIVTLAITLGFWVLDFASGSGPEWLRLAGELSPTQALKQFERGLVSIPHVLGLAMLGVGSTALASLVLSPGLTVAKKVVRLGVGSGALALGLVLASVVSGSVDLSDDRRNSFDPADEAVLRQMSKGLEITLFLSRDDSRAREFQTNVLAKLRRLVPGLKVVWGDVGNTGPFGAAHDDRYGIVTYDYGGRRVESRSNSAREILPILHELASVTVVASDLPPYRGYPAVIDPTPAGLWFYGGLPVLVLLLGWRWSHGRRLPAHLRDL